MKQNLWIVIVIALLVAVVLWAVTRWPAPEDVVPPQDNQNPTLPSMTPTPPAGIDPVPTPTARRAPTPELTMAEKTAGTLKQGEVGQWMRETQRELMQRRIAGEDTAVIDAQMRQLNLRLSQAGYDLFSATDAASTRHAEQAIEAIRADLQAARVEAGMPATPEAVLQPGDADLPDVTDPGVPE